ncbi:MAG TPA: hypothetical protein VFC78_12540 [Tepidisphaeraceae bacterium]|nr:hypothetical protein [Tepidisphaeraceae bacterium]
MESSQIARRSTNERLSRLGILHEPMGYVDGANLYEFVADGPIDLVDPLGLDAEKTFTIHDTTRDGSPADPQGTVTVSLSGTNLCAGDKKGKIELKVVYKPTSGISGKASDEGYLVINGTKVDPTGKDKEITAKWSTEVGGDGKGHSGRIYVAAVYKPDVLDKKEDPDKIGRTGVLHVIVITWKYNCNCGALDANGLRADIKLTEDKKLTGQLPTTEPAERN